MVNIGVIGAGYWGKNLVRVFSELESVRLRYVADHSADVRESIGKRHPSTVLLDDHHPIIDDPAIDAVVIASPAVLHHELAKEAILAGKHVFVEKPMTLSVDHSLELVELAEKHGRILMVGHLLLYHPCVCAIREMILRGEIGDVRYVYSQRLNLGKVRSDENALVSLAPHDISVILHLIGKAPEIVGATGGCFIRSGIEDVVFLSLGFSGGVRAHAHVSWLDPHKVRRVTVVGSKKMIEFDDMEPQEKVRVYDKGVDRSGEFGTYGEFLTLRDGDIHIPDIPMMEPLARECAHFVECIETGKTPVSDGRNGLLVTRVLDAGLRSLKEGGTPVMVGGKGA